jgi:hypothetical protein
MVLMRSTRFTDEGDATIRARTDAVLRRNRHQGVAALLPMLYNNVKPDGFLPDFFD